jgi:hypothetical protein
MVVYKTTILIFISKDINMARPKKKDIKLTTDSFLALTQEAYNELVEQRSTCIRTINENKGKVNVEDMHDLTNLNKANTDLLKIVDTTIDKKITLVKLISQLVFKPGTNDTDTSNGNITPEDMALLRDIFKSDDKDSNDDKKEYKIK